MMAAIRTEYRTKNVPETAMSDDDFYGRQPALEVDLDICRQAALVEARRAFDKIVWGRPEQGKLELRRTVYRLAVACGNHTEASEWISGQPLDISRDINIPAERQWINELDRGAGREHPHPNLIAELREIETALVALKKRQS